MWRFNSWKRGGTGVVLVVLGSVPPGSPLSELDLRWVHLWWHHSRVAAPEKRIEEPQAPNLVPLGIPYSHCVAMTSTTLSWWSWLQAFVLHTPSVIAMMCPLLDRGTYNMVLFMWMNACGQSGLLSMSSISFWAASTRAEKQPWWRCAHIAARLKTWSSPQHQCLVLLFQFSLRPDEVHLLTGWKLVFNNPSSIPEKNLLTT